MSNCILNISQISKHFYGIKAVQDCSAALQQDTTVCGAKMLRGSQISVSRIEFFRAIQNWEMRIKAPLLEIQYLHAYYRKAETILQEGSGQDLLNNPDVSAAYLGARQAQEQMSGN